MAFVAEMNRKIGLPWCHNALWRRAVRAFGYGLALVVGTPGSARRLQPLSSVSRLCKTFLDHRNWTAEITSTNSALRFVGLQSRESRPGLGFSQQRGLEPAGRPATATGERCRDRD